MTYCVAVSVDAGMVFCSDSLTNAGIDQVSTYSKMFRFALDGEKVFVILTAGNLATSQATIAKIKSDIKQGAKDNLLSMTSVEEAADYVGDVSHEQQEKRATKSKRFEASFIIGGQVRGSKHEIILIYPEGNHITTSADTPFLQIGESKYGKPILDRILTPDLNLDTSALCTLVSMDSTMRSNLSVGPPIELLLYRTDTLTLDKPLRFESDSDFLRDLKRSWDQRLKDAFRQMPPLSWATNWDKSGHGQSGA
ncbi:MAG: peptidase [Pseudohongiellaceae bacterium]